MNRNKSNGLVRNIIATVAYYDAFEYPLTAFEIWKYLIDADYFEDKREGSAPLGEVVKKLAEMTGSTLNPGPVEFYRGFYFLRGRKRYAAKRILKSKQTMLKIKKLKKIIRLLRFVPFVRMIGLTGRMAMKNVTARSDWDVLVVLKGGRIWTGRTIVTFFLQFIGKRRHREKVRNRICLNYFVTDDSLKIKTKDLFSASEYYFMVPLFDAGRVHHSFQLKNSWIKKFKPNYQIADIENMNLSGDSRFSKAVRAVLEKIFGWDFLEKRLERWEKEKIKRNPKTHRTGSMIEAASDALVFLPEPKGPKIFDKFKENMKKISCSGGSI